MNKLFDKLSEDTNNPDDILGDDYLLGNIVTIQIIDNR